MHPASPSTARPLGSAVAVGLALVVGLAPMLSLGGCGVMKEDRRADALEAATSGYRQSIRWGYYAAAVGFLHPDQRAKVDMEALKNIRVTSYETVQPAVIQPDNTAVELVEIEYVLNDRQQVKSLGDRQQWRYDTDKSSWWLMSGLPRFAQ